MTARVLFSAPEGRWAQYEAPLRAACAAAGVAVDLSCTHAPEAVDYMVFAPNGPVSDFTPFTRCRLVQGLWAGVESVVDNPTLTQPLARMVDPEGLTQGMVEWVTGHVLRHHLGMDAHIVNQGGKWEPKTPPLAPDRRVTVLGLGALGAACARALSGLGFAVTGWARSAKDIPGVHCLAGTEGFAVALDGAEVVAMLLPLTPETGNVLDRAALARLAPGAVVLNPGRGGLIDDAALLEALGSGRVGHATLDTFRVEPLPRSDPYWDHPRVTVTPHIASETRPASAARVVAENLRRGVAGEPFLHLVDRRAGY